MQAAFVFNAYHYDCMRGTATPTGTYGETERPYTR
jgi:hypothetical protein